MADHLKREELKRNELGEAVEASVEFAGSHLRQLGIAVSAVIAAALVAWGIVAWLGARTENANDALAAALRVAGAPVVPTGAQPDDPSEPTFATAAARDAKAQELFERLVEEHGSTDAGGMGRLWLADRALRRNDSATARRLWQEYLDAESDGTLAASARRNLIRLDRAEGKGEALVANLGAALESGRDPLPADALLWELGETQKALGHAAEAHAAYQKIVDEHPSSPWASEARRALAEASGSR
jgi:predicted negative regulator of RcsB-dependent stress response